MALGPRATLGIKVSSSTAGASPMFMLSPAPLMFPFGALEGAVLKLQEEWWDFRHTDPRMEQGFLRGPFLEPPQITSCRCHLYLAQSQYPRSQSHQSPAYWLSLFHPKDHPQPRELSWKKERARRTPGRELLVLV